MRGGRGKDGEEEDKGSEEGEGGRRKEKKKQTNKGVKEKREGEKEIEE